MKREEPIQVVTGDQVPGREIEEVKGLVWGTAVRSKFLGKDILAFLKILSGGEVPEYTEMINKARKEVIDKLVKNAESLDADAVVDMDIGSTAQIIPGTVEIFAYGTAVKLKEE